MRVRSAVGQFDYYRRSTGLGGALRILGLTLLRPIYFRDSFVVTVRRRGPDWSQVPMPGEGTVRVAIVRTAEEYDAVEPHTHPYVRQQGLREFLADGDDRYVALTEFCDDEHPPQFVGFRMFELARFIIHDYGFGGPLPSNFVMNLEVGIAPEFRGHRLLGRAQLDSYRYQDSIGVDTMVSLVRSHNAASFRATGQVLEGSRHDLLGPFAITSWFGGLRRSTPDWNELRRFIVEE
ncbi:MAG: hypothetical protein R3C39_00250 [Dehalococcoidia bacterium]